MIRDEAVVEHLLCDGEWLARIARAITASDELADAVPSSSACELTRDPLQSADEAIACAELRLEVMNAVLALPEPDRAAVILRIFDDWPFASIAQATRATEELVRERVRHGVAQVKVSVQSMLGSDENGRPSRNAAAWVLMFARLQRFAHHVTKESVAGGGVESPMKGDHHCRRASH